MKRSSCPSAGWCTRRRPNSRRCRRPRTRRPRRAPGRRSAGWRPPASPTASNCPTRWDAKTGENILWRTPIPGLAHSSPIVWGDRVFVTSADQQRRQRDLQARPLRRRRRLGRSVAHSAGCSTRSTSADGKRGLGAHRRGGRAAQQAPHQVHLRERHAGDRRPGGRRLVRIAGRATPTTSTATSGGRSISAASTWAPTTSRRTSGGRRARPSSGTAS